MRSKGRQSKEHKVSIVLATYNRLKDLPRCIDSVLQQTFQDWELVIIDDGSTDATADYALRLVMQDPRIRYMKQSNRKQALAKNAGIQASFGRFITFIDSDDRYLPHHIESRLALFEGDPKLDLVEGGFEAPEDMRVVDYYDQSRSISIHECVTGATFFGKREVFFELEGFQDVDFAEDTDFWLRAEKVFRTRKIQEPKTYVYSCSEKGLTQSYLELTISGKDPTPQST